MNIVADALSRVPTDRTSRTPPPKPKFFPKSSKSLKIKASYTTIPVPDSVSDVSDGPVHERGTEATRAISVIPAHERGAEATRAISEATSADKTGKIAPSGVLKSEC